MLKGYSGMKLLEFALIAATEAIRQDHQRQVLIEMTPPLQNYDFTIGQSRFSDIYYPHITKEKVLESANKIYKSTLYIASHIIPSWIHR